MREILFQVSAAAVLTAVVKALIPSEQYEKQFKILLSCFFLSVAVGAFRERFSFSEISAAFDPSGGYYDYTVQLEQQTADEIAANLREGIRSALEAEQIFPEKIYIDVHISGESDISISEIRLVLKEAGEEGQRAVRITQGLVGAQTAVTVEEI